jgi:integrase
LEGTGYIGYRKMESGSQTWQARWRGDDGKPLQKSLGRVTKANDFAAAKKAAEDWFNQCAQGVTKAETVEAACKAYVKNLAKEKPDAATDPMLRFKKLVYDTPFGKRRLDKLLPTHVRDWRNALATGKRKKSTVNRIMRSFKAAMNFAYENGLVASDRAWSVVNPFPVADGQRENFLTKAQVKDLLNAAPNDLAALLKGYLYTGCRPGELPKARVKHFDAKAGMLMLSSNKGRDGIARAREVPLAGLSLAFFKEQAKDKLPNAFLMTKADGEAWTRHDWRDLLQVIREEVNSLPHNLVAYDLRHTTISNWLANGVNLETVAKVTGTSIGMIEKHYHKFIPTKVADQLSAISIM